VEPTIEVNRREYPYREGATVSALMAEHNFDYSYIIVKINGAIIEEDAWPKTAVAPGDKVDIIHVFGGG
jgi:thiamine biosynthesis protein ThiS